MEIILLIIILYFLPSIIGSSRQHNDSGTIFLLNLLLGWTVIGWCVALIWSFGGDTKRRKEKNSHD